MNAQFLKEAINIVDNLTAEEIRKGLEAEGIIVSQDNFFSVYSNKPLAEVPYEHLAVGMPVVHDKDGEGKITELSKENYKGKSVNGVKMAFANKIVEAGPQSIFKHVQVK